MLDTNALIHWHFGTMRAPTKRVVVEADLVAVSPISGWEIAIKQALGKLKFSDAVEAVAERYGFHPLAVTLRHADAVRKLPRHHADPFDRLLIAQALEDGFTILTSDRAFEPYRVPVIWA